MNKKGDMIWVSSHVAKHCVIGRDAANYYVHLPSSTLRNDQYATARVHDLESPSNGWMVNLLAIIVNAVRSFSQLKKDAVFDSVFRVNLHGFSLWTHSHTNYSLYHYETYNKQSTPKNKTRKNYTATPLFEYFFIKAFIFWEITSTFSLFSILLH